MHYIVFQKECSALRYYLLNDWIKRMLIIDQKTEVNAARTVLTIGKFDGLHIGHMKIIKKVLDISIDSDYALSKLVVSFVNHPDELLKDNFKGNLMSETEKTSLLMKNNIDYYCPLVFDSTMRDTEAEVFFNEYIVGKWHARALVVGDDFCFGKGRKGNIAFLEETCKKAGIDLYVVQRETYLGEPVSSSRIRAALEEGLVFEASVMLGRKVMIKGIVEKGNQLGRTIGFPTINVSVAKNKFLPRFGVYGGHVIINGEKYRAISNIGVKPTVGSNKVIAEANIYDFDEDVYDCFASIALESFIRPELHFNDLDELKKQIEIDKKSFTND